MQNVTNHPTKPASLRANPGIVSFYIRDKFAGHITTTDFPELDDRHIAVAKRNNLNPADFRMIGETETPVLLSAEIVEWLREVAPPMIELAKKEKAEKEAKWAAERAAEAEADRPHLQQMERKIAKIIADIPAGCIQIDCHHQGSFDGYPKLDLSHEGTPLSLGAEGVKLGAAHAIRPGAMGAFASRYVAWATPEAIEAAKASHEAIKAKQDEAKSRHEAQINAPVPAEAVAAYKACRGNPENFHDDIDHPSYWLVKNHAAAIEHQGLA